MSEKLHATGHEKFEQLENTEFKELKERAREKREKAAEAAEEKTSDIDTILENIEKEARPAAELSEHHSGEKTDHDIDNYAPRQMTDQTYSQTIRTAQKKLSNPERKFSKIVHAPKIEIVSEVVGNTIARPSGLLWGGLFSVLSSMGVLILCRYYGYEYNFSIGLISFAGGYLLGLLVESIVRIIRR